METLILAAIISAATGWILARFVFKQKPGGEFVAREIHEGVLKDIIALKENKARLEEENRILKELNNKNENELKKNQSAILELSNLLASKDKELENAIYALDKESEKIKDIEKRMREGFSNLATEILDKKSKQLLSVSEEKISTILNPLKDSINAFNKDIEDKFHREALERATLKTEIQQLGEITAKVSGDAENLTKALKGDSQKQGAWGEIILEKILEFAGLERNRDYLIQPSFTIKGNKRLRPDAIVNLPANRQLIIDSKVSLTAYERYSSTGKKEFLSEHGKSIIRHVDELAAKSYPDINELNSVDIVLMFMPVEPAIQAAIKFDPGLISYAAAKNIIICGPSALLASLKLINILWQKSRQTENARKIAEMSGALYDKIILVLNDISKIHEKISQADELCRSAELRISGGKGCITDKVEAIRELGIENKKELPEIYRSGN